MIEHGKARWNAFDLTIEIPLEYRQFVRAEEGTSYQVEIVGQQKDRKLLITFFDKSENSPKR
jgi:hypothetical protein